MAEAASESSVSGGVDAALFQAVGWLESGRRVALVAVMSSWHGAFTGNLLVVAEDGASAGSLSGGCVEGSAAPQALRAIEDGEQRLLSYAVTDGVAMREAGLTGGGSLELFLEPVDPDSRAHQLLRRVAMARAEGQPVATVTDLVTGLKTLVYRHVVHGGFGLDEPVLCEIRRLLSAGRSVVFEPNDDARLFVHVFGGDFPDKCDAATIGS